jgi:SRSO17 transposase
VIAVTAPDLDRWGEEFEAFHARFASFFRRREPRELARQYLRGLLSPAQRKNGWQLAQAVGARTPDPLQHLLYGARWDAEAVLGELQRFVVEHFGHPEGVAVVDESAFPKKGNRSAGVKRQWCSTLGKTENCQVAVFLSYVSLHGHTFLDRRLYLPQDWCEDEPRRARARVPGEVMFQTKPQLACAMLAKAWAAAVPMRWVTADEGYGNSTELREAIEQHTHQQPEQPVYYVLAIAANTHVWRERPAVEEPCFETGGRPRKWRRLARGAARSQTVSAVVAGWEPGRWERLTVAAGEKGPRTYDWAAQRVVEYRKGLPKGELWLLARRSPSEPHELAYYFSNAPAAESLATLAQVAGVRWSIEQCLEEAKGETGLDEYEVRYWHSWQRHVTLSLMAHAWLASIRQQERGQPGPAASSTQAGAAGGKDVGVGKRGAGRIEPAGSAAAPGARAAAGTAFA